MTAKTKAQRFNSCLIRNLVKRLTGVDFAANPKNYDLLSYEMRRLSSYKSGLKITLSDHKDSDCKVINKSLKTLCKNGWQLTGDPKWIALGLLDFYKEIDAYKYDEALEAAKKETSLKLEKKENKKMRIIDDTEKPKHKKFRVGDFVKFWDDGDQEKQYARIVLTHLDGEEQYRLVALNPTNRQQKGQDSIGGIAYSYPGLRELVYDLENTYPHVELMKRTTVHFKAAENN